MAQRKRPKASTGRIRRKTTSPRTARKRADPAMVQALDTAVRKGEQLRASIERRIEKRLGASSRRRKR